MTAISSREMTQVIARESWGIHTSALGLTYP